MVIGSTPNDPNGNSDDIADNTVSTGGSTPNESNDNIDEAIVNSAPERHKAEENEPQLDIFTHPEDYVFVHIITNRRLSFPATFVNISCGDILAPSTVCLHEFAVGSASPLPSKFPLIFRRGFPLSLWSLLYRRTYMKKKTRMRTADCISTRVRCQYRNRSHTVIIGRIPDKSYVIELSGFNESKDELSDPVDSDLDFSGSARELFGPEKSDSEPIGVENPDVATSNPETTGKELPSSKNTNQQRSGPELTQIEAGMNIMKHTETGLCICAHDHDPMVVLPYQINNHINSQHSSKQGGFRELRSKIRDILQRCAVNEIPANIQTRLPAIRISRGEYCFWCREVNGDRSHDDSTACKNNWRVQVDCQICFSKKGVVVGPLPEIPRDRRLGGR